MKSLLSLFLFFELVGIATGLLQIAAARWAEAAVFVLTAGDQPKGYGRRNCRYAEVTAYTTAEDECGKAIGHPEHGIAADGRKAIPGYTAAADDLPLGTEVYIEGIGWRVIHDRFGAGHRNRIDILVETKGEAWEHGRTTRKVCTIF